MYKVTNKMNISRKLEAGEKIHILEPKKSVIVRQVHNVNKEYFDVEDVEKGEPKIKKVKSYGK